VSERVEAKPIVIAGLYHDLVSRRSLVTLAWDGVNDKRLTLNVPFGCTLADLPKEAERALREFASDIATASVKGAA